MQGNITIADVSIGWFISDENNRGVLFVQDGLSGKQFVNENVTREQVSAAVAVAMLGDGCVLPDEINDLANSVQPSDPELRFIP